MIGLGGDRLVVNLLFSYLLGNRPARNWSHVSMVAQAGADQRLAGAVLLGRSVALIKVGSRRPALGVRVTAIRVAVLLLAVIVSATVTAGAIRAGGSSSHRWHRTWPGASPARAAPRRSSGSLAFSGALLLLVADQAAQLVVSSGGDSPSGR